MKKELKNTKKKNNKGFSLVELIVVIAIMAVLMAVLAPAMLRYVEKSREQKDNSAVSEATNAANIALADDNIVQALTENCAITVTVDGSGNGAVAGDSKAPATLVKEVTDTVGTTIKMSSKKYKNTTYTISITADANGVYKATGAWPAGK